jgi:subtilisin
MSTSPDDLRASERKSTVARESYYMIAPGGPGVSEQTPAECLKAVGADVVRTLPAHGTLCPPVAVARLSDRNAAALLRSSGGALMVELDVPLRAASFAAAPPLFRGPVRTLAQGFATTIEVLADGKPVDQAEVLLAGEQETVRGITGPDGKVTLRLFGELPETVMELLVQPRSGCWPFYQQRPKLQTDAATVVNLHRLSPTRQLDWGGTAMGFDRLPTSIRGAGVTIALIDSGVATNHKQLTKIAHGIDLRAGDARSHGRSWAQDVTGHGTPCAGIISAVPDAAAGTTDQGARGYAPDAELHVCKLPADARCSDLVAALDYCLEAGIDVACLGYGCTRGSLIVEQRIMAAKQQGIALIAAAGNSAGPVQFPACSPHVLAVGAVGQAGTFPDDSPQAAQAAAAVPAAYGDYVPPFACQGPELDLCAPAVAVISCASPDGYVVCDGTSLAAAHAVALAALILGHHADFRRDFSARDFRRVERLFQILKATARPIGHPWLTGAGLPDAARALGLPSQPASAFAPLDAGLRELRIAMRLVDTIHAGFAEPIAFEPLRGPAAIAPVPLNPFPWTAMPEAGVAGNLQALNAAMMRAGLPPAV